MSTGIKNKQINVIALQSARLESTSLMMSIIIINNIIYTHTLTHKYSQTDVVTTEPVLCVLQSDIHTS